MFIDKFLKRINDGVHVEYLKASLRGGIDRVTSTTSEEVTCFYSTGHGFEAWRGDGKLSGSSTPLLTTGKVRCKGQTGTMGWTYSGGGGDRLPTAITKKTANGHGARLSDSEGEEETATACLLQEHDEDMTAYVDSAANQHFMSRLVRLHNLRGAQRTLVDATGRRTALKAEGELELEAVDENGKPLDPIVITASQLENSPMNLLSVSKLCEQGLSFQFAHKNSYFTYNGHKFPLEEENGMYIIRLNHILRAEELESIRSHPEARKGIHKNQAYACAGSYQLWHDRLGHASTKRIKFMYENGMAEGLDVGGKHQHYKNCTCANCMSINNSKVHIGDTRVYSDQVTQKGQLVYSDLSGPYPASVEGYQYTMSFTDVCSRFSVVYLLKKKSEAEAALKAYIVFCRRDGVVLKEIRSDNGGEFGGHQDGRVRRDQFLAGIGRDLGYVFDRVCNQNDIKHTLTPHDRPELNGLAERWNRTCFKMANAMLFSARLSHVLWSAAIAHANMLRNRLPVEGLGKLTPYEIWYGRRPRVGQLKVFGCDCYKLLNKQPKVPGQMAREKLLYIGETADRLGFRCFNPRTYKFTTEFELIFDEESVKNRADTLLQYDDRRRLNQEGKLETLPLVGNDYKITPAQQQHNSRSIYMDLNTGESSTASRLPATDEDQGVPEKFDATSSSPRALDHKAASSPLGLSDMSDNKSSTAAKERTTRRSKNHSATTTHQLTADDVVFNQPGLSGSMGPAENHYGIGEARAPSDTSPTRAHEVKGTVDGVDVTTRSYREPKPQARSLSDPSRANDDLDEADQVGPLSEQALERARARSAFDPRHPLRPMRILPISRPEPDTEDFKAFRKFAYDNDILIKMVDNPKRQGSKSWHRYNLYQSATSLKEIVELSLTAKTQAERARQRETALKDITYDCLHGFVLFPNHENRHPSHYVNSGAVALAANVVNVHRLYSEREVSEARGKQERDQRDQRMDMVQKELSDRRIRKGIAMVTFNNLINDLWEKDSLLQDLDLLHRVHETSVGAALVADLINDNITEPESYHQIASRSDAKEWYESVEKEHRTLEDRGTWRPVKLKDVTAKGCKPIKCRHVFRVKKLKDNSIQRKSRLVAQGFSQRPGTDFNMDETYAGVISYSSMRFLLSLACQKKLILTQTDITGAYLEAPLEDDVYMQPPPNMWVNGQPPVDEDGDRICLKLQRCIYGLRQAGHFWSSCFREFMTTDPEYEMGFTALTAEPNLYRKTFNLNGKEEEVLVGVYVDDCIVAASSEEARQWFLTRLSKRFPVNQKSTGLISFEDPGRILSMHVRYDVARGILEFDQREAIEALAKKFEVEKDKPKNLPIGHAIELQKLSKNEVDTSEYMSIIGSCLHIAQVSRPDISFAVGALARHSATPGKQHMECARDLINYLYNTREFFIGYKRLETSTNQEPWIYQSSNFPSRRTIEERLEASVPEPCANGTDMYCDADYAGDKVTRRSTSGMIVMMNGGPISWSSRLQKLVALSSAESEIYAVTDSVKEALHIRLLCEECEIRKPGEPMTIWEDNNAAIHLGHGLRGNSQQKHFAVRLRFLHEHVQAKTIEFSRIDTKDQLADGFTKALPGPAFANFRRQILKRRPEQRSVRFAAAEKLD